MKHAARFLMVALLFATSGLFAQAAVDEAEQPAQGVVKLAKKSARRHHRHHLRKAH